MGLTPQQSGGNVQRNWFGTGSNGDIRITSTSGAEQSFDNGQTWTAIPGWTRSGNVVLIPSVLDGDMVVADCVNLTVDAGMTLTTANRCRGLWLNVLGQRIINGTVTMTGRGCHANPAETAVSDDTPVPPSDGHPVPPEGFVIRRLAKGHSDTHSGVLGFGGGLEIVASEARQPAVRGNGIVIAIPRIGGEGGAGGGAGGTVSNGTGGGGGGGSSEPVGGPGSAGTCWSGGSAGGYQGNCTTDTDAEPYAGKGGDSCSADRWTVGGVGNPGGSDNVHPDAPSGTGGILVVCGGIASGSGTLSVNGVDNNQSYGGGGGSGAGVLVDLPVEDNFTGARSARGGIGAPSRRLGATGGAGTIITVTVDSR